jgi:hypothetical protein
MARHRQAHLAEADQSHAADVIRCHGIFSLVLVYLVARWAHLRAGLRRIVASGEAAQWRLCVAYFFAYTSAIQKKHQETLQARRIT